MNTKKTKGSIYMLLRILCFEGCDFCLQELLFCFGFSFANKVVEMGGNF